MAGDDDFEAHAFDGEIREVLLAGVRERDLQKAGVAPEIPVYGVAHAEGGAERSYAHGDVAEAGVQGVEVVDLGVEEDEGGFFFVEDGEGQEGVGEGEFGFWVLRGGAGGGGGGVGVVVALL